MRSPRGRPQGGTRVLSRQLMRGIECAHKRPVRLKQIRCQHYKKGSKIIGGKKDVVVETESVLTAGPQEPSLPTAGRGRGASLMGEAPGASAWWAPCVFLREGPKEQVATAWCPVFPRAAGAIAQAEDSPWLGCAPSCRPWADICRAWRVILPPSSPPNLCTLGPP